MTRYITDELEISSDGSDEEYEERIVEFKKNYSTCRKKLLNRLLFFSCVRFFLNKYGFKGFRFCVTMKSFF